MYYEMMTEPPTPGTPLESLMLMVWRGRQDIELQKTRAVVQATLAASSNAGEESNKNLRDSWQDLLDEMFPFQRGQRKGADQRAMEYLKQEVARGPLRVIPLQPVGKGRSKLRTQYQKRERRR